jgi:hypothetical protein
VAMTAEAVLRMTVSLGTSGAVVAVFRRREPSPS